MPEPSTRTCYLISSFSHSGFLVNLDRGRAEWSCSAHQAIQNHHAWLDKTVAVFKLKEAQKVLPDVPLEIVAVDFVWRDNTWYPTCQHEAAQ